MKRIIIFLVFAALILCSCGKIDEAKKAMDAVKQVANVAEDTADSFKNMDEEDIKKIKLNEKEVRSFFSNIAKVSEKYPDIHFQVAQIALVEALGEGKNLKDIVNDEMDIDFTEYVKLSTVISLAEGSGAGLQLSKSMYEQMISGKKEIESQLNSVLSNEEREELENALAKVDEEIAAFEKEMKSDEFDNVKHNYKLITKIKEEFDI